MKIIVNWKLALSMVNALTTYRAFVIKPVKSTARAHARELQAAARLWEASVKRTGVDYAILGSNGSGV